MFRWRAVLVRGLEFAGDPESHRDTRARAAFELQPTPSFLVNPGLRATGRDRRSKRRAGPRLRLPRKFGAERSSWRQRLSRSSQPVGFVFHPADQASQVRGFLRLPKTLRVAPIRRGDGIGEDCQERCEGKSGTNVVPRQQRFPGCDVAIGEANLAVAVSRECAAEMFEEVLA